MKRNKLLYIFMILMTLAASCKKDEPQDIPTPGEPPVESVEFEASNYIFEFDSKGTPIEFTITSAHDWRIEVPASAQWCKVSPDEGSAGVTTVTLTPAPITDRTPRKKQLLTLYYGTTYTMLSVSQTMPNNAPDEVVLAYPSDDATDVKINVEFTWNAATDADGDEVSYELWVSEDNGENWMTIETSATRGKMEVLLDKNTSYIWKVITKDTLGGISESEVRSFMTGDGGTYKNGEVTLIQLENAGASKPVHLIFMGDGFIEEDYIEGGAFDRAVDTAIDAFFSIEPYPTYRNYFRISTVAVYSEERGATVLQDMKGCPAQTKNTAFKSTLEGGTSTNTSCDYDKVFSYALSVPDMTSDALENTTVILLINIDAYAGTCMMNRSGRSVSMCPMGKDSFEKVVSHEAGGHGFGRLLDEYRYTDKELPTADKDIIKDWRTADPDYGYNISLTNNRDEVHWKHYFSLPGYEAVGLYEGGCLYKRGVWRPEEISCMEDNRPYYNAPSREAIVKRIMKSCGKSFDLNAFLAKDVTTTTLSRASLGTPDKNFVPLGQPVLIDNM